MVNQLKTRAISVGIAAKGLQFYSSGTFSTSSSVINHAVTLIGYNQASGYLIKNSWGMYWGKEGYAYVN